MSAALHSRVNEVVRNFKGRGLAACEMFFLWRCLRMILTAGGFIFEDEMPAGRTIFHAMCRPCESAE